MCKFEEPMNTILLIVDGVLVACKQAFPRKFVQKVGKRAQKRNEGGGGGKKRKTFLFSLPSSPPPPPTFLFFPLSLSNFRAITHLKKTFATQASVPLTNMIEIRVYLYDEFVGIVIFTLSIMQRVYLPKLCISIVF